MTLFGRDSLIVAMESIGGFPEFAIGALNRLAAFQATDDNPEQDKEPGKVPHELRFGELAELGLLPFAPYYGTHDATPLFIVVLSYAYEWSADKRLLRRYLPAAEAALRWVLEFGDRDGDGFQEYATRSTRGLFNQGWKDSAVAIQHARRHDPRGADRPLRIPGLRLRRPAADGHHPRGVRRSRGSGRSALPGGPPLRPLQRRLLVGGRGNLLPRARRQEAADPNGRLECRPLPRERHRPGGRAGQGGRPV